MTARDTTELTQSEDPAVELLVRLGYTEVSPDALDAERSSTKHAVLAGRLQRAIQRLNPWITPQNAAAAVKMVTQVPSTGLLAANEAIYRTLTYGESVRQDLGAGIKSKQVRFFDFEDPRNNELIVARQYRVRGVNMHIKPDLTVFVNGVPLAVIECKRPDLADPRGDAIEQLHRYQESEERWRNEGAPKLFETAQILIAAWGTDACYGTTLTPGRFYFEWREPYPLAGEALDAELAGQKQGVRQQERVIYSLLRPENLLDVVRNFIVFEVENGLKVKKLCRYKQFVAVNRAIERITTAKPGSKGRGGVVWHTQGSGKSLTMVWLALKLRREAALHNPGVVIVTDRTALDKQITRTFKGCGFEVERAKTVRQLRELLANPIGKTIMTTVQKFQELREEKDPGKKKTGEGQRRERRRSFGTLSDADNLVVMVDEAHRSQYRGLAANMREALPKAAFLGFTGTPIDKKDKSTLDTFGPYIDTYTIQQAVADGATVRIVYEGRLAKLRVIGTSLDALFDNVFADRSEEERAKIKQRYANERALAEAPRRIEAITLDIIGHFRDYIAESGFKAQIAASSRDAALRYYDELTRLNGPTRALVISSRHNDEAKFRPHAKTDTEITQLVEDFVEKDDPKILIVCDRLLTGFDAPVEQVLYLDKPLREHNLLQAIARTNRRYKDTKTHGLVVDYWGVSEELEEALRIFDPNEVRGALEPKIDELPRLEARHRAALRFFDGVRDKDSLSDCLEVLDDDDVWAAFDDAFRAFARSLDMLYPAPEALRFVDDARWLGKVRKAARTLPGRAGPDMSDCGAKVQKLIEDAVSAESVSVLFEQAPIFSDTFDAQLAALGSAKAKASRVEHALRHEIHVKLEQDPAFYGSLKQRLEDIIADYEQGRIDESKRLQLSLALRSELLGGGQRSAEALGLSGRGFAIYGLLARAGEAGAFAAEDADPNLPRDVAASVDDEVEKLSRFVDWDKKEDVLKELRRNVAKKLRKAAKMDRASSKELAVEVVELAKKRGGS
ncbi:type I restriction endonuclease subunit R [Pseudenhygromyxa sp. WMMC2535]|uniref:type I restriction endonuclease subunit R n=1 Tax=Pseudenhygromyxa sp. WMMC2535 TaxID=2712867 RepID=UPI0015550FAE|nr:type I restriction endonuclease subunit R [Pseudenhygromyxa sp. WMMC2535]NVB39645.1 type I restriction endonuclease subunit R [Pseudenhygromyxa sp. WMMC2535]